MQDEMCAWLGYRLVPVRERWLHFRLPEPLGGDCVFQGKGGGILIWDASTLSHFLGRTEVKAAFFFF